MDEKPIFDGNKMEDRCQPDGTWEEMSDSIAEKEKGFRHIG